MRVSFEGDPADAQRWMDKARQELDRLKQRMATQGLDQGKFQHVLDSDTGAYCMGYVLPGGIEAVHIVTVPGVELVGATSATSNSPDFVSGAVVDKTIITNAKGQKVIGGFFPTIASARVHDKELRTGNNRITRLAVGPFDGFEDISQAWGVQWSQMFSVLPGLYSGQMRGVVQCLLGFGKRPFKKSIYDIGKPLPSFYDSHGVRHTDTDKAYEAQVKNSGLQVDYDFRFLRTHGITLGSDDKKWVVEISQAKGILAMPLPLDPVTMTPEFAKVVQDIGDTDAQTALAQFGGFPTGEPFPPPEMLDAYIRAGRIIRLLPAAALNDFYQCEMYSSSMGWAFNTRGSEAHNTAYYFHQDNVQRGVHYAINLHLGSYTDRLPEAGAESAKGEFSRFASDPRFKGTFEANMWKIDHMSATDFVAYHSATVGAALDAKYGYINTLVLPPLAVGSASLGKISEGNLYWPTIRGAPEVKFPEPILGYLLSHDMRSAGPIPDIARPPRTDTTMHVFFAGDELKWVKAFADMSTYGDATLTGDNTSGSFGPGSWDYDYEVNYLPVGDFTRHQSRGPYGIPATVYTSDFDDRKVLGSVDIGYRYKRRDMGGYYETLGVIPGVGNRSSNPGVPSWAMLPTIPEALATIVFRNKWFAWETWRHEVGLPELRGAVAAPFFDREAAYYAKFDTTASTSDSYVYHRYTLTDPNTAWVSENFDEHGVYTNSTVTQLERIDGSQLLDNYHRDWYDDTGSFADNGVWLGVGEVVNPLMTREVFGLDIAYDRIITSGTGEVGTLTVHLTCSALPSPIQVKQQTRTDIDAGLWEPFWFAPSPDPDSGLAAYIAETASCLGDADLVVYQKDINTSEDNGIVGTPPPGADLRRSLPTFIGVIS